MKAEPHTMTLKTKQHSWLRGVQFFRKHIMWGMWTRAWLLFFVCVSFSLFFILRLSGLCTADEHSVNLPDLIYALTSYRVREHLAHVKMLVKIATFFGTTTTIFAYLLSFLFTKFALGRVCQVLTQWRFSMNPKQTQSGQNSISRMTGSSVWLHKETTLKGVDLIGILCK